MKVHLHEVADALRADPSSDLTVVDDAGRTIGTYLADAGKGTDAITDLAAEVSARVLKQATQIMSAVKKMRALQREYFRTRHHEKLQQSKQAEREVDRLLAELDAPAPKQGGLFE